MGKLFDIKNFLLRANFQPNMRNTKNHIDGEVIKPEKSNSNKNNLQNLAAGAGVVFDVHTR